MTPYFKICLAQGQGLGDRVSLKGYNVGSERVTEKHLEKVQRSDQLPSSIISIPQRNHRSAFQGG